MTPPRAVERTAAGDLVPVELTVNGTGVSLRVPARMTLADALRERLGLTGTHLGCEHGVCGMCTVLVDGEAARSCLLFACQADRAEVVTVEGLGTVDDLHPLQESFGRHHGLQCGFCTPGFLMSSYDLLRHDPAVERADLPAQLSGVICRCTGYRNIVDAVDDVATTCRAGIPEPKNCGQRVLLGRSSMPVESQPAEPGPSTNVAPGTGRNGEIGLPGGEPTFRIDVTSALDAPQPKVCRVLDDVHLLARCLPGAELTEELGADQYAGRARVVLGPIRLSFNGIAHLVDREPGRLRVLARGDDVSGGRAQAEMHLQATETGEGTSLRATAGVYLSGRIAGFGRSLAGDVARRMFEEFSRAVDTAALGEEPVARPAGAFRLLLRALRDRLRRPRTRRDDRHHRPGRGPGKR